MDKSQQKLYLSLMQSIPSMHRRKASVNEINQISYLAEQLKEYEKVTKVQIYAKQAQLNDLIEFGFWIKDQRILSNSTVVAYLTTIITHIRSIGTDIMRMKIIRHFPYAPAKIPTLTEDIVQAILETQVQDKHRHVLDAIKLILLHGFRYSDLWVLRKGQCIHETDGMKHFKYNPPKNRAKKKGEISVLLHPLAEPIIEFWKDKRTFSVWNENRAPKYFSDRELYPHLQHIVPENNEPYFVFEHPIIKIPHHFFDRSVKHAVFMEVHKTWLTKFHYQVRYEDPANIGLMSVVPGTEQELWETLSYHTFRHVYCSRYLAKGGNLIDLRDNVGHSSIAVTQKYLHTNEAERLKRSANIMNS